MNHFAKLSPLCCIVLLQTASCADGGPSHNDSDRDKEQTSSTVQELVADDSSRPIAVTSFQSNRIDLFYRGADNTLRTDSWNGTQWVDNVSLGGSISSAPVARAQSNAIDVVARDFNGHVVRRTWSSATGWGQWTDLGAPAGVAVAGGLAILGGNLTILARGEDNHLYARFSENPYPTPQWQDLGLSIIGTPAATYCDGLNICIVARGTDNSLMYMVRGDRPYPFMPNRPAISLGGVLTASPALTVQQEYHPTTQFNVFVRDSNGALQQKNFIGSSASLSSSSTSGWGPYTLVGGHFTGDPIAIKIAGYYDTSGVYNFRNQVFVANVAVHSWTTGAGWTALYGNAVGSPSVGTWGLPRLDVFTKDSNSLVQHRAFTGSSWVPASAPYWESHVGSVY